MINRYKLENDFLFVRFAHFYPLQTFLMYSTRLHTYIYVYNNYTLEFAHSEVQGKVIFIA